MFEANQISKWYRSKNGGLYNALKTISFEIKEGSFNAVVGKSGSGKTTLLKLLGAIEKPTEGSIKYNGLYLDQLSSSEASQLRAQDFGFAFPNIGLLPHLNCEENIVFPKLRADKAKLNYLSGHFSIDDVMNKYPFELSLGERQRVLLARSIYETPKVLIADEPTANLDWDTAEKILFLLKQIQQDGMTICVSTHDDRVRDIADNMILIK